MCQMALLGIKGLIVVLFPTLLQVNSHVAKCRKTAGDNRLP